MDAISGNAAKVYSSTSNVATEARLQTARDETLKKSDDNQAAQTQAPKPGVEVTLSAKVEQASEAANINRGADETRSREQSEAPQPNTSFSKAATLSTAQEGQRQIDELV